MRESRFLDQPDRPFYVGYQPHSPPGLRGWLKALALVALLCAAGVAWALGVSHARLPHTLYEFGINRTYAGRVRTTPYPMLEVALNRDGRPHTYHLVLPGKMGAQTAVEGMNARRVRVDGALIARQNQLMLEIVPGTVLPDPDPGSDRSSRFPVQELGRVTLTGEIVDGKCFLGAMNPGTMQPHRGCAVRCLSGGIVPLFVVRGPHGAERTMILVDPDGGPVPADVQVLAGLQLRLTGQLQREGDLLFLQADPATYERLW